MIRVTTVTERITPEPVKPAQPAPEPHKEPEPVIQAPYKNTAVVIRPMQPEASEPAAPRGFHPSEPRVVEHLFPRTDAPSTIGREDRLRRSGVRRCSVGRFKPLAKPVRRVRSSPRPSGRRPGRSPWSASATTARWFHGFVGTVRRTRKRALSCPRVAPLDPPNLGNQRSSEKTRCYQIQARD
jgi:hypothetical protein